MMDFELRIKSSVFNKVYRPYVDCTSRIQVYFGGSSSGKSVFLAQRDVMDVLAGGRNFLVCRQVGRTMRGSVIQEVNKVISDWKIGHLFDINKTDGTITCKNGFQIVFVGLDDVEKLKSITPLNGVFTDIRIEEATEIDRPTFKLLRKRQRGGSEDTPKRIVLSFNPILQSHWIYTEFFTRVGWADAQTKYSDDFLTILKTTYKDNRFLTKDDVWDLENEEDKYYRDVYTFGNWGILGNVIFTNWKIQDLSGMHDQFVSRRNGLDFGFSNDPAALSVSHYDRSHKTIYIFDEVYEVGLTNDILADEIKPKVQQDPVTCDSAEPKSIAELKQYGIKAFPSRKGRDSVVHGIQWLQQQTMVVDKRCIGHINELRQYKWKEDPQGNPMRVPVELKDHLISAMRYAYETDMRGEPRKATSHQGY